MTILFTFAAAGLVTYLLRSAMVLFGSRLLDSPQVTATIELVSPAVIAAIVASAVLLQDGQPTVPGLATAAAVGGGAIAVHRTSNVSAALFVGLPIYWLAMAAGLS